MLGLVFQKKHFSLEELLNNSIQKRYISRYTLFKKHLDTLNDIILFLLKESTNKIY